MKKRIRILLIRNDHIGDMVYSTPIFREIKRAWPHSEITVIASELNKPMIEKNPHIDRIIELCIPKHKFSTIVKYFKMSLNLRKEKFDYGIDLRGSIMNSFFLLYLAGVRNRISQIESHPVIRYLLTSPLCLGKKNHIFKDNQALLKKGMNIDMKDDWPEIITDEKDEKAARLFLEKNKLKRYICVCPVAGQQYKQWDLENFKNLFIWLDENYPLYKILFLGTKKDKADIDELAKYSKNSVTALGYNVRQMVLLFNKSKLVIAHDGGPMHSAWLTGSNTLALFPANTEEFIPLRNCKVFVSKSKLNMKSITLTKVKKAIKIMLLK